MYFKLRSRMIEVNDNFKTGNANSLRSTWWKLNILETSWFLIEKFKKLKIFKPSAHNAIVSEENSKDSNK